MNFLKQLSNPNFSQYTALITENNQYSYQELDYLSNACVSLFLENNLSSNTVALLCFQNQSLQFIASIAALKIGACHLALQPGGSLEKKSQLAFQTKTQVLVTDFEIPLNIKTITISLDLLKSRLHETKSNYETSKPDSLALIVPGSGTTGTAKLIGIDYNNLDSLIARDLLARPIQEKEHHLSFTPVEFYTAKRRNFSTLMAGGCVILREQFKANLYQFFENHFIEHISIASSHAKEITQINPNLSASLFSKTKTLFLGGSPISEKLRKQIRERITENLYIAYGTNEIGECCIANPQLQTDFENCVGKPLAGVSLEIVDSEGKVLANNLIGHLRIKTDARYSYYLNHDKVNDTPASDWFYPGDYALINDEGVLILKGRSDDAITYHGTMIYPREIEQLLEAIDEVGDAAAFALESEDNQIPAVVFTASRPLNIKNVDAYLKRKLGWLAPQFIQQIEKMPKNDAGKILKREIKISINKQLANKFNNAE